MAPSSYLTNGSLKSEAKISRRITNPRNIKRANLIDLHVGSRVRSLRQILGLSQEQLAARLGLTFQQVQKYENGKNRIGASRLFEISRLLRVSVQYFYDDLPREISNGLLCFSSTFDDDEGSEQPEVANTQEIKLPVTQEVREIIKAYYEITDPVIRRQFLDLMISLATSEDKSAERD